MVDQIVNIFILSTLKRGERLLDKNWISWKYIDNKIVGKRCVSSKGGFRYTWLEEVEDDVHKWLCGKDADYNETFFLTEEEFINGER